MSKEEIKNLLIDFICEYNMTSWSNEKVYEKFSDIIYKKFTDLEAKLAVSENTITNLVEDNRASQEWYKKQLAEKDELIGTLKNKYECADRELYLTKDTLKHHTNIYNSLVDSRNQDKISFAVEQLEKVKEYIKFNLMSFQKVPIIQEIDNQIKQLKEMPDEK